MVHYYHYSPRSSITTNQQKASDTFFTCWNKENTFYEVQNLLFCIFSYHQPLQPHDQQTGSLDTFVYRTIGVLMSVNEEFESYCLILRHSEHPLSRMLPTIHTKLIQETVFQKCYLITKIPFLWKKKFVFEVDAKWTHFTDFGIRNWYNSRYKSC